MQFTRNVNCTVQIALVLTPLLVGAATASVGTEEKRTMLDKTKACAYVAETDDSSYNQGHGVICDPLVAKYGGC